MFLILYILTENCTSDMHDGCTTILSLHVLTTLVYAPWRRRLCRNMWEQIKNTQHIYI